MASKLNYPKPYALQGPERLHPPLHWHDKTAIGLDKTAIGIDIEAGLDKMAIGVPALVLSWEAEKTFNDYP